MNATETQANTPAARYTELREYAAAHPLMSGGRPTPGMQFRTLGVLASMVLERFPAAKTMDVHLPGGKNQITYVGDIFDDRNRVIQHLDDTDWQEDTFEGAPSVVDFAWELDLNHPALAHCSAIRLRKVGKDVTGRVDLAAALAAPLPS